MVRKPSAEDLTRKIAKLEKSIAASSRLFTALRESEQTYRTLSEKSVAGIYVVQDGKFQGANYNAASYAGYTIKQLVGRKSDSIVHPDDREKVKGNARMMLRGERSAPHEFRIVTRRGDIRWIMETVSSISYKGRPAILGNSMDITERKRAEEKLQESEDRYRTIFETTGTATIIVEEDTTVSLVNTEFEKLSGASKAYWEGKRSWREFVAKKDVPRMMKYHALRRKNPGAAPRNYEFSFVDRQGNVKDVLITISMIPGTQKSVASFADITERKRAEEKLQESEDRYRTIFETTGTATIIVEEDTTVSLVNTEFEKLSGASKAYWEGKRSWREFVAKKDVPRMMKYHALRRKNPGAAPRNYEFSFVDRQGNVKDVLITISMIPGTQKSVASFADITERKRAEEALKKRGTELEVKTHELKELNAALRVLFERREEDRNEVEEKVTSNVKKLVLPYLEKLKKSGQDVQNMTNITILESNLKDIVSTFSHKLSSRYLSLTPKEIQVANLIKEGKTSKEIAEFLNVSSSAIHICRYRIRNKLGLNKTKSNLQSYLSCLT